MLPPAPATQKSVPLVVVALRTLLALQHTVDVVVFTAPATSIRPTMRLTAAPVAAEGSASPTAAG
jgi:hypothetical protein